jgi:exopolysaccharide biosynthesis polyprenyl glycosylphosphotransferase
MLRENWRLISRIERLGDCCVIAVSFLLAYYGRKSLVYWNQIWDLNLPFRGEALGPLKDYFIVLAVGLIGYLTILQAMGAYSSMRLSSSLRLLRVSLGASLIVFFLLAAVLFTLRLDVSRSFIGLFCVLVGLSLAAERYLVLALLRSWRRRGLNFRNVIICGTGPQALRLAKEVSARPELGVRVRAFACFDGASADTNEAQDFREALRREGFVQPVRVLAATQLERALREYAVDEVIFADILEVMPQVEKLVGMCSEQGVRSTIAADLFSLGMVQSGVSYLGGMPLIHFQTPPGDRWELALKRMLDIAVSALLLALLLLPFLVIALAIWLDSGRPILFRQRRVGLHGRLFYLYKFRSMQVDAEKQLETLRDQNEMSGPVFKITNDPRVTRVGKILRRFSLDELPQLWNVLKGEMSLVGPRPPVPGEVGRYERPDRRRLSMRPGMTCIWQVSGRNQISAFEDLVKLDLQYIDNWSLGQDFKLLFKTVPAVLRGVGAR